MSDSLLSRAWASPSPRGLDAALLSLGLRPLAAVFGIGVHLRAYAFAAKWARTWSAPAPVISVGGIEVGGVGKTPLVAELARLAASDGRAVAVLSRGYGGRGARDPLRVPWPVPIDGAERFGDEPCLLAERLGASSAVWVGADRVRAARSAVAAGAELLLLDDGFQHRRLARAADVVSLAGAHPFANRRLLPAGPLREPVSALARATRVVVADPPDWTAVEQEVRAALGPTTSLHAWRARPTLHALRGSAPREAEAVHLLSGIAHPERFAATMAALGAPVSGQSTFADHHAFRATELREVVTRARGAAVVTTEKDWMRLRGREELFPRLVMLRLELEWIAPGSEEEWARWIDRLAPRSGARSNHSESTRRS